MIQDNSIFEKAALLKPGAGPVVRMLGAVLAAALLVWTCGAEIYGFATHHLFSQMVWLPWGLHRFLHFAGLFAAFSFLALLFAPWGYATLSVILVTAATVVAAGSLPVLAVAFFLVACCAAGTLILGPDAKPGLEREVCATLLGAAVYVFVFTLVARVPVNTPAVWLIGLAVPIAADFRGVLRRFRDWFTFLQSMELPSWSERLAFALLLFAIIVQWAGAIAPEVSADGLGIHLAVPANIAAHHALTFQPNDLVWSVMPLAGDFAFSIVYLLGGEAATSLLNLTMLLAIAALLYCACRRCVPKSSALLLTALFVTTPLVQLVTGSLFVENFVAAMALGALAAFWMYSESGARRLFLAAAILGGGAIAAKVGMWAVVLIAAPFAVAEARRRRLGMGTAWLAAALLIIAALPPYAIAYIKTGNPLFPFFNDKIPSTALARGVVFDNDTRYAEPLRWSTPYDLTFRTHKFFESQDGGMGFAWLLLIPLAALALLVVRNRRVSMSGTIALAAGTVIFLSKPNGRYLYTVLPLFVVAFAGMLEWLSDHPLLRRALLAFAMCCAALNLYFVPASSWYRKDFYSPLFFRKGGREQYLKDNVPVRYLAREFRRRHPQAPILMIGETDLTDIGDGAYQYLWHQWPIFYAIATAQRVPDLRRVLLSHGIHYVSYPLPGEGGDPIQPSALREYLSNCAAPILQKGRVYVSRIDPGCESASGSELEAEIARIPAPVMEPGTYDDFDPAILFHGEWVRSRSSAEPYHGTVSYTDVPGALLRFAFAGESLTYVHTNSTNGAIVELNIDGVIHEIDCYSPTLQWQARSEFAQLGSGRHTVTLRSTGRANPSSRGKFIYLDAFLVR